MSEYNIQMNKYNALNAEYDQLYPATKIANVDGLDTALQNKADLGEDGKVPESQLPSMGYSKPETLSDTTKALFGLGTDAVPDDAFALLSRFQSGLGNEYVWGKGKNEVSYSSVNLTSEWIGSTESTRMYSDAITVKNGEFYLINPITITLPSNSNISALSILKSKYYVTNGTDHNSFVLYFSEDTTFDYSGSSLRANTLFQLDNPSMKFKVYGYVNSPDPNAYPPAVSDGYTYTPLGQMGAKVQIATGSYTGTGTYGSSNPNTLTFSQHPRIVFIHSEDSGSTRAIALLMPVRVINAYEWCGFSKSEFDTSSRNMEGLTSEGSGGSETVVKWYGANSTYQLNNSGVTYRYFGIIG